ncbi:hypothetical protein D0S45_17410 [Marinifilum sp. JC120]|nr:hypothetical protein D0S45_17410 [Marinifilum sp. JC120]
MFNEDFRVFLNPEEFAVEVRCDNPARTFAAIFDDEGSVSEFGGIVLENARAILTCTRADTQGFVWERTEVEVAGHGKFTVMRTKPADGMVIAELE